MNKRLVPLALVAAAISGLAGTGGFATHASEPTGSCPPIDATDLSNDSGDSDATVPEADDLESRCDIDPAVYYQSYANSVETAGGGAPPPVAAPAATAPANPATQATRTPDVADEDQSKPAPPPPAPVEPGILDDNTFVDAGDSGWVATEDDRESTFGLDVDTGSYSVAQGWLAEGYRPEPASIRPEEWINSFEYGDAPADGAALAATVETDYVPGDNGTSNDPVIARIGITTEELADEDRPAANITFVIDTSGSMDIRERLGLVKSSLALLVRSLRDDDTIAIVTYENDARPVLAPTPLSEWREIVDAIDSLQPGGSTNLEAGLRLGYEQAEETFDSDELNVVVLASDGVANAGVTDSDELTDDITKAGEDGIHLVTVGYGMGNYNDNLMEQLANQGDGFYSYVDTYGEAVRLFVDDLTPTLTVVAEQAKVQVVFDDEIVASYRLIGYENRQLDDSDFTDDTVDAGELGAGHQVSAVYELELVEDVASGADASLEAGTVKLRWQDPATDEVTEIETSIDLADATPGDGSLRLAALVGHTAEVLKGSPAVIERGLTLEELGEQADELAGDGVEGADELAEFIHVAINAQPVPATTDE